MIVEFDDGRKVTMPECVDDDTARRFKRALIAAENETGNSKAVAELFSAAKGVFAEAREGELALAEDGNGTSAVVTELRRIRAAVLADRVMVADEIGEYNRSRAVLRKGEEQ